LGLRLGASLMTLPGSGVVLGRPGAPRLRKGSLGCEGLGGVGRGEGRGLGRGGGRFSATIRSRVFASTAAEQAQALAEVVAAEVGARQPLTVIVTVEVDVMSNSTSGTDGVCDQR
jgi:hypothetical protein